MKRIGYCLFAYDKGMSGISNYIDSTISELQSRQVGLTIFSSEKDWNDFCKNNKVNKYVMVKVYKLPFGLLGELVFHTFILPFIIKKYNFDKVIFPAGNRRLPGLNVSNAVAVFHDLSQMYVNSKYDFFRMFYFKKIISYFLKNTSEIHCVSKNTMKDMLKFFKINPGKVKVNYNGFNFKKINNIETLDIKLNEKVLTYVSRLEAPGKNHINIVKAVSKLPLEERKLLSIVFVGKDWGGKNLIVEEIKKSNLESNFILTGHLNVKELEWVYSKTSVFIHPSLYEGFGFPLLEAMARNIPCICSDNGALDEIGGDAAIKFCPTDINDISDRIIQVLHDVNLQNILIKKGSSRYKQFSWVNHVDKLLY
jgi:glycosyltransferase involved in cell wall biosynthesis